MTIKEQKTGGRPLLEEQAENAHQKAEVRISLAMSKAVPTVLTHLLKMVGNMDKQKDNINLTIIDKVIGYNKETRKIAREMLSSAQKDEPVEEEEDYDISISLTSSDTSSKALN
tara:strand:- start:98 stop:439 length:342 start_codon:yes stop_codon:yes gene_type:complete